MTTSWRRFCGRFLITLVLSCLATITRAEAAPTSESGHTTTAKHPKNAQLVRQDLVRRLFLDHFTFGVEAPSAWFSEVAAENGAAFDFTLGYLSTGVGHGDTPWFFKFGNSIETRILDAKKLGKGCWFTWYMLSESAPANWKPGPAEASPVNARVAATMKEYFEWYTKVLIECGKHPEVPIVIQFEPDEWCHLLISGHMDPAQVDIKIGSCGDADLRGLPDNLYGYAKALSRLRDTYAPVTLLACNPSAWDWRGVMSGTAMGKTFKALCCPDFDLAAFETSDRDAGQCNLAPPFDQRTGLCENFTNHIQWIKEFHEQSGLWVCLWQVSVGNTYFKTCNNTTGHFCDNIAQFMLEGYPRNDGIARYAAAGCCGCMFNGCIPGHTAVFDEMKDGVTNPPTIPGNEGHESHYSDDDGGFMRLMGGVYYKHPLLILGQRSKSSAKSGIPADVNPAGGPPAIADDHAPATIPIAAKKPPRLMDPSLAPHFNDQLRERLIQEIAARRCPTFTDRAFGAMVRLESIVDSTMTLHMEDGGEVSQPWSALAPQELVQLALFQVRDAHPSDHALAAFYLLLAGNPDAAQEHLARASTFAEPVCKAFNIN